MNGSGDWYNESRDVSRYEPLNLFSCSPSNLAQFPNVSHLWMNHFGINKIVLFRQKSSISGNELDERWWMLGSNLFGILSRAAPSRLVLVQDPGSFILPLLSLFLFFSSPSPSLSLSLSLVRPASGLLVLVSFNFFSFFSLVSYAYVWLVWKMPKCWNKSEREKCKSPRVMMMTRGVQKRRRSGWQRGRRGRS